MNFTFNGTTEIITPTDAPVDGAIDIDVQDLYSRWVDWMLTSDNSKYQQAMRVVGGDPLPGSKQLGLTYFLLNGWKIKPYEADHIFTLNGNLYSEDGSSPFEPTAGAYNVTIISSVSNLVDSTLAQMSEIEYASYNGEVTIDAVDGTDGVDYPIGTSQQPCKTIANALAIAVDRGFHVIHTHSDLTITSSDVVDNYTFTSENWSVITIEDGASTIDTNFEKVSLYGVMSGWWNVLIDCWVYDITNFTGWIRGGSYLSVELAPFVVENPTYTYNDSQQSYIDDPVPMYVNVPSVITMNDNTNVSITNAVDVFEIKNLNQYSLVDISMSGATLILDSSCVAGDVIARGVGTLVNNGTSTVEDSGLVNAEVIGEGLLTEDSFLALK
jgi:hypothetical protein